MIVHLREKIGMVLRIALSIGCSIVFITAVGMAAESGMPQSLKKIVIGYSGISPSQAPAWIAYEAGFFRKYGLEAQLIFIESGSRTVQTLLSGDVVAAQVAGTSVVQSNLQGSGVVLIGGFLN